MAKKPLSGRERDRLARMKSSSPKKVVRKRPTPVQKPSESPSNSSSEKEEAKKPESVKPAVPESKEAAKTPTQEEKKPIISKAEDKPIEEKQSDAVKVPKPVEEKKEPVKAELEKPKETKDEKNFAPKTFSAIQKEGALNPAQKEQDKKGEIKTSNMAEQTTNQGHGNDTDDNGRDASQLVENVSKKPLRYALMATLALVAVVFLSQKYGPSHEHGHSEAAKTEEGMPSEMHDEATPALEESGAEAEETVSPVEDEATPVEESETSDETTSSVQTEEVVETASGLLQKPFWGFATAAVDTEADAKRRVEKLKAKGFEASYLYIPDYIPGGLKLYRVFIGPFPDENGVRKAQKEYDQSDAYTFSIK